MAYMYMVLGWCRATDAYTPRKILREYESLLGIICTGTLALSP